ncbi:MAG: AAA family ATPase [Prevotellaceae bacterium]|jgi:predicted ATP-dependent endonuclease of OLD family|nr:AAA family ATPase [Prevotellaceae bacterium]
MTQIKDIKIENFRCFDKIEVNGLSKVNVFVGANNSGKSSILEAVFLTMGMSNPMLPVTLNSIRGLGVNDLQAHPSFFKYLFHDLSLDNTPSFKANFADTSERSLVLCPLYARRPSNEFSSIHIPEVNGVEMRFTSINAARETISSKSSVSFEGINVKMEQSNDYQEPCQTSFVTVDSKDNKTTLQRLSDIVKTNRGISILDSLQCFDPKIKGIQPLSDGIYFRVEGVKELLPSNIMGDGIRRFLNIIVTIEEGMSSFVCIDEIENGLHYTAHKTLWKALMSYVLQHDIQLFVTTHNIETLSYLTQVLEEEQFAPMQEYTKVFKIAKTKLKGYQAFEYAFDGMQTIVDNQIEIR